MKAEAKQAKTPFALIEVTVTLESEEEVGAFYSLFKHKYITDATVGRDNERAVRGAIDKFVPNAPKLAQPFWTRIDELIGPNG